MPHELESKLEQKYNNYSKAYKFLMAAKQNGRLVDRNEYENILSNNGQLKLSTQEIEQIHNFHLSIINKSKIDHEKSSIIDLNKIKKLHQIDVAPI